MVKNRHLEESYFPFMRNRTAVGMTAAEDRRQADSHWEFTGLPAGKSTCEMMPGPAQPRGFSVFLKVPAHPFSVFRLLLL